MANPAPLANESIVPTAKPEGSKPLAIAVVMPVPEAAPSVVSPAPAPKVIAPQPVVAPSVQVENREAVKPEVQSTLPPIASSKQAMADPLPAPSGVTPEALRANHAASVLSTSRDEAGQGPMPAGPSSDGKSVYTGEPISLNLKDVDLKDFFRLIHEISGLNIILDPNVTGSVTLVLDSVPWDQALDIVMKNNRLGKVLEGNVLRIAKIETLTAEQDSQTKLAAARMDAAPLVTVFRPINYAKAQDISTLLKSWAGGGALSRRGTVLVDVRGNTLIISDVASQIPIIENVVSKIDKKAKQVSIEARVVLATADFTRTLSSSLLGGFKNNSTVTSGVQGSNSSITIPVPTSSQPFPVTTVTNATASGFGVASVVNVGANYFINAAISAAEERDQAKTLSRPSIVTQNNVQGMVMQGVQVPIQTSINNTISVQYENATLQLTVTPQVTDDNNIFLIIMVNNASVGAVVSGAGPSINTQQATTQVLVPDGGTVVFGGITVTSRSKSATYIPLLGNIPVLGHLFKTSNNTDSDQELLFFVTPKILPG
jgi:type IV pilus assembly protein PilQ